MSAHSSTLTPHLSNAGSTLFEQTAAVGPATASARGGRWQWYAGASMLLGAVALLAPARSKTAASVQSPLQSQAVKQVTVVAPAPVGAAEVVLPATVRPWQSTVLFARANGYLSAWHRDLGEEVKAGELLALIDTPELDQELAEAEARASQAEASTAQAVAEEQEAQAELDVAVAQLARNKAEMKLALSQLNRRKQLVATNAVSQEEHDAYLTAWEAKQADVAAAEADLVRRKKNLETRSAVIRSRLATAQSRKANVERLNELQTFKKIVAPFDGIVTRRDAEVGMLVSAGQEPLFVVEDIHRVRVQLNVPQTYSKQTIPGAAVVISIPETSDTPVQASVTRIAHAVDDASRTMLTEIELDNRDGEFQPGSYVQVALTASQGSSDWTIPTNTLLMRVDGPHVAVVDAKQQVNVREVKLGRDLGKHIVVVNGIDGRERLIVNPGDSLATGQKVRVAEPDDAHSMLASTNADAR